MLLNSINKSSSESFPFWRLLKSSKGYYVPVDPLNTLDQRTSRPFVFIDALPVASKGRRYFSIRRVCELERGNLQGFTFYLEVNDELLQLHWSLSFESYDSQTQERIHTWFNYEHKPRPLSWFERHYLKDLASDEVLRVCAQYVRTDLTHTQSTRDLFTSGFPEELLQNRTGSYKQCILEAFLAWLEGLPEASPIFTRRI